MKEIWKNLNWCPNYKISNLGNVMSTIGYSGRHKVYYYRERIIKQRLDKYGYCIVHIRDKRNNINKMCKVHRLVAETFLPNVNFYSQVNHKDENKLNNCVNNLEWCDVKYNTNYGTRTKRISEKESVKVSQFDLNNNFMHTYNSLKEASLKTNTNQSGISMCVKGKYKSSNGFIWRYADK